MTKKKPREIVLLPLLQQTYSSRRDFITSSDCMSVKEVLDKYPALKLPAAVSLLYMMLCNYSRLYLISYRSISLYSCCVKLILMKFYSITSIELQPNYGLPLNLLFMYIYAFSSDFKPLHFGSVLPFQHNIMYMYNFQNLAFVFLVQQLHRHMILLTVPVTCLQ